MYKPPDVVARSPPAHVKVVGNKLPTGFQINNADVAAEDALERLTPGEVDTKYLRTSIGSRGTGSNCTTVPAHVSPSSAISGRASLLRMRVITPCTPFVLRPLASHAPRCTNATMSVRYTCVRGRKSRRCIGSFSRLRSPSV